MEGKRKEKPPCCSFNEELVNLAGSRCFPASAALRGSAPSKAPCRAAPRSCQGWSCAREEMGAQARSQSVFLGDFGEVLSGRGRISQGTARGEEPGRLLS